jgi:hypothetical protein
VNVVAGSIRQHAMAAAADAWELGEWTGAIGHSARPVFPHPQPGVGRVHDAGDVPAAAEHEAHIAAEEPSRLVGRHPRNDVVALGRDDVVSDIQRY